jgi:hypothetical protein
VDRILGPRLAGSNLFYGEIGAKRTALQLASGSGERRKLLSAPPPTSSSDETSPGDYATLRGAIAASEQRLGYAQASAAGNARYQQGNSTVRLFGGGVTGPFAQIASCSNDGIYGPASDAIDADGFRVASTDCAGSIVIRDYSGPDPSVTSISAGQLLSAGSLALAGDHVAYNAYGIGPGTTTPRTTTVYDWAKRGTLYEVPRVESFDVQSDGTLAGAKPSAEPGCEGGRLSWFSRAEPTEHVLPVEPCRAGIRVAGGRIAVVLAGSGSERVLSLVDLDGNRTDVARLGSPGLLVGEPDYDGTNVAYALSNCLGGADLLIESAVTPTLREESSACPVRIRSSHARLAHGSKSVSVPVGCAVGCAGLAEMTGRIDGAMRTIGVGRLRVVPPPSPPVTCAPAPAVSVRLARAARVALRSGRKVVARLVLTTQDRTGDSRTTKRRIKLTAGSENRKLC